MFQYDLTPETNREYFLEDKFLKKNKISRKFLNYFVLIKKTYLYNKDLEEEKEEKW